MFTDQHLCVALVSARVDEDASDVSSLRVCSLPFFSIHRSVSMRRPGLRPDG